MPKIDLRSHFREIGNRQADAPIRQKWLQWGVLQKARPRAGSDVLRRLNEMRSDRRRAKFKLSPESRDHLSLSSDASELPLTEPELPPVQPSRSVSEPNEALDAHPNKMPGGQDVEEMAPIDMHAEMRKLEEHFQQSNAMHQELCKFIVGVGEGIKAIAQA